MKQCVLPLAVSLTVHTALLGAGVGFYQSARYAVQQAPSSLEVSFSIEAVRAVEEEKAIVDSPQSTEKEKTVGAEEPKGRKQKAVSISRETVGAAPRGRPHDMVIDQENGKAQKLAPITPSNPSLGALNATPPALVFNLPPVYPRQAREQGVEGMVVLRVVVLAGGRAGEIWVESSSGHSMLDESALKAVEKWQFSPAKQFGRSVASTLQIPVIFQLDRERKRT